MLKKQIVWCVLILALLVLAGCSSTPKAPDYNTLADSQDMRFVGEWKADSYYYYILNADGTGVHEYLQNNGERAIVNELSWRTTQTWLSILFFRRGSQVTRPFIFSDNDQTITFGDAKLPNGYNAGTASWTKFIGE